MTRGEQDDALAAVRDLLRSAGIEADVDVAGKDGEIAVIRGGPELREPLARQAPGIRSLGFRYVALEPGGAHQGNEAS